jgi:LysM repeat protein
MAAVRHLEAIPDHRDAPLAPRHLRLVDPVRTTRRRRRAVYRRRRVVAGVAVAVIVVTGARVLPSDAGAGGVGPAPAAPVVYVVQPGDSYWSIAASLERPGDVRATVDALTSANGDGMLQVGDRITLPG